MPDVIIKGMQMPEYCTDGMDKHCPLWDNDWDGCSQNNYYGCATELYGLLRPRWCPLRPAPDGMERLTPKKPTRNTRYGMGDTYSDYFCPGCSRLISYEPDAYRHTAEKFCYKCGQAIDWTEV